MIEGYNVDPNMIAAKIMEADRQVKTYRALELSALSEIECLPGGAGFRVSLMIENRVVVKEDRNLGRAVLLAAYELGLTKEQPT